MNTAGTLWEYDRIRYRIDSGMGLGAFSSERSWYILKSR